MHEVELTFLLDEEVTPAIFAQKVALACARGGALRPGEAILHPEARDFEYRILEPRRTSMAELGIGKDDREFLMPDVACVHQEEPHEVPDSHRPD